EITPMVILRDKTRLELNQARRQIAESRVSVADAVGLPVSALAGVDLAFDFSTPADAASNLTSPEARRQALQTRPDILSALAQYAATQSALQLEIARQYPDVHLGTGYQFDEGQNKCALGATVELPVLNRNQGPNAKA